MSPSLCWPGSSTGFGWLLVLAATGFVIFSRWMAAGRYGKIPLGRDGEKPEFRTASWVAMMFSAGMGIGRWRGHQRVAVLLDDLLLGVVDLLDASAALS